MSVAAFLRDALTPLLGGAVGVAAADQLAGDPLVASAGGLVGLAGGLLIQLGRKVVAALEADRAWKVRQEAVQQRILVLLDELRGRFGRGGPSE